MKIMFESIKNLTSPILKNSETDVLISLKDYPVTEIYQTFDDNNFEFPKNFDQELRFCSKSNYDFLKLADSFI